VQVLTFSPAANPLLFRTCAWLVQVEDGRVYCLPDMYQVQDRSLGDIQYVLNPTFTGEWRVVGVQQHMHRVEAWGEQQEGGRERWLQCTCTRCLWPQLAGTAWGSGRNRCSLLGPALQAKSFGPPFIPLHCSRGRGKAGYLCVLGPRAGRH